MFPKVDKYRTTTTNLHLSINSQSDHGFHLNGLTRAQIKYWNMFVTTATPHQKSSRTTTTKKRNAAQLLSRKRIKILTLQDSLREKVMWREKLQEYRLAAVVAVDNSEVGKVLMV